MNIALWVLQVLVALVFLLAGFLKLTRPLDWLSQRMLWVKVVPVWMVRFIGAVELLGAFGLILPAALGIDSWLTPLAAVGLVVTMLAAAIFHAQRNEYNRISSSLVLLVLAVIIVFGRYLVAPF
ncbi:MAG TPA: DoxX family protein [Chloroflexia bacterium]|nr:DoxX family protein [Chloroflexia bacterium]